MDTKPMTDVLKNAAEVASLASTDRLVVADSDGNPKKIKDSVIKSMVGMERSKSINVAANDWVRIIKGPYTSTAFGGMVCLTSVWGAIPPRYDVIVFGAASSGSYTEFNATTIIKWSSPMISAIRLVRDSDDFYYIEVQFRHTATSVTAAIANNIRCDLVNPEISVAAESSVKATLSLISAMGGGKPISFNTLRNLAERRVA